jgi:hypothetical protein
MIGKDTTKWKASFNTLLKGTKYLGKLTFLIREAFPSKLMQLEATELLNHCHGKSPVIR